VISQKGCLAFSAPISNHHSSLPQVADAAFSNQEIIRAKAKLIYLVSYA
jgi:hypothetical protein